MSGFAALDGSAGFWMTVLAATMWGVAGGFSHCIGMCGVFVLTCAPVGEASAGRRLWRQVAFQAGRLIVLCALGAAAGEIGSLVGFAARFARAQGWLTLACGATVALLALGYAGVLPKFRVPEPDVMGAGGGAGRKVFAATLRSRTWLRPLGLGLLVGLLPCGLTYAILIPAAATLSAAKGSLVLLAFGLGTIPGLLTLGMLGHLFRGVAQNARFRTAMTRGGAIVMLVVGVVLVWRSLPNLFLSK